MYNGRALCLFWEADLWLRPSWLMSTVQNPKKSCLAGWYRMPLWGRDCPLPALAALACLSPAGDGPVHSQLALLSPLFFESAWRWLGLFAGIQDCRIAIPQSGLLSQASSLRLPSGQSGPVHILNNAGHSSVSLPCLLVRDASIWAVAPQGVAVRHVICGF